MREELFSTIANPNKTEKSNGRQCSTSSRWNQVAAAIISHIVNEAAANFPLMFNKIWITLLSILFLVILQPNHVYKPTVVLS